MALSAIGDAVLTTDPDGLITYMNPVAESLTGWSAAEALGKRLEDVFRIVNEETRKPTEQPVRKVIDTGLVRGLANHTLLIARDGSELPIDDSAAPVWGEDGKLVGVVMIFRDIRERRRSEHIIESARGFAESIVTTVREPLLVLKADLHVRSANRSFYETFRVEPSETEGRFIYDLGDGQWDIPALRTLLEEIIPQNSSFNDFEVEHDFETIGPKTMLLNARRFPPEGKWELILLAIADITERKRLEREREGLLKAAEVARDRAERDASKLADADRQKNQFLAMLAHELRNPLAAVRNAVEVAARSGSKRTSNGVGTSPLGRSATSPTSSTTCWSRPHHRRQDQLRKELIDAAPVVRHAIEAVKPIVDERKHELLLSFTSTDLKLEADSTRLEQMLVNLLTNAAKYTPIGGRIQLIVGVEGKDMVFRVRDNGLGILPELIPQMFDLFTQADRSLDRSEGGLGIGLTLIRSLAELHGGTVTRRARPRQGERVRRPASRRRGRTGPNPRKNRRLRRPAASGCSSSMTTRTRRTGWPGCSSSRAMTSGLPITARRPSAWPVSIGPRSCSSTSASRAWMDTNWRPTLRREEWSKDSVLIAVSGYGEEQARDRSKEAGFHHHLVKPVNFDTILALIGGP